MPKSLEELRLAFAKRDSAESGKYGEKFARHWFQKNNWNYVDFDQGYTTMHRKLRELGGKRPDFIVETDSDTDVVVVDAKFATTDNGKSFAMPEWEIEKYRQFKIFAEAEIPGTICEILFMIFPKEFDGKRLVWVELTEFFDGDVVEVRGSPGRQVSLEGRDEFWDTNE
nr:hypothetical protein [Achromobacter ruhlandii]